VRVRTMFGVSIGVAFGVAVASIWRRGVGCALRNRTGKKRSTDGSDRSDKFKMSDAVTDLEESFPFKDLLVLDYFQRYRRAYYTFRNEGWQVQPRNYCNLLQYLSEIERYSSDDAKTFAKMFRDCSDHWHNGEATFAEVIVYRSYVRLAYEGIIKAVRCGRRECDVIVERLDGSLAFLEVLTITPDRVVSVPPDFVVNRIKTGTQDEKGSVRQKLLHKIKQQGQMTEPRENYAVVELNDLSIAGDFAVLSSLSGGYRIHIDLESGKQADAGYDWSNSFFADPATRNIKAVIWFSLGDYGSRRFLWNPLFQAGDE
jgi:hypothetical protein